MAGGSEKFCLRWNDFESNISVAFRELREDKDFFDVTLACDEDQIQAHKVILSACSPFFRSILRRNRHEHPLLYMKGVKFTDMVSVLNFMYHGEVNVAQEELNSFLAVAEDLKVKGLTQNETEKKPTTQKSSSSAQQTSLPVNPPAPPRPRTPQQSGPPFKRSRTSQEEVQEVQEVQEVEHIVKREPPTTANHHMDTEQEQQYSMQEYAGDYGGYEEGATELGGQGYEEGGMADHVLAGTISENKGDCSELMAPVSPDQKFPPGPNGQARGWRCVECDKRYVSKSQMEDHIRTWHLGTATSYNCQYCGKQFQSRNSRSGHVSKHHKLEVADSRPGLQPVNYF